MLRKSGTAIGSAPVSPIGGNIKSAKVLLGLAQGQRAEDSAARWLTVKKWL